MTGMMEPEMVLTINKNVNGLTDSLNSIPHWKTGQNVGFIDNDQHLFISIKQAIKTAMTNALGQQVNVLMRMNANHCSFIINTVGLNDENKLVLVIRPVSEQQADRPVYPVVVFAGGVHDHGPSRLELNPDNTPRVFWIILSRLDDNMIIGPGDGLSLIRKSKQ